MNIAQAQKIIGKQFGFIVGDANKVIQDLNLPKDVKILDVGTGMGYFAILLALNGYEVLTGEPETDNSIYAKQDWIGNLKKVGVSHLIEFQSFEAHNMSFTDNAFDAIFFFGVLHHIDEKSRIQVLQETVRTSKKDSIICFMEPNENGIKLAKKYDSSHPEAADPKLYMKNIDLSVQKTTGDYFDSYILRNN